MRTQQRRIVGLCKGCRAWRFYRVALAEKSLMLGICMGGNGASEFMSHRDRCGRWQENENRSIDLGACSIGILRFEDLNTDKHVRAPQYSGETVEQVWEVVKEYMGYDSEWGQAQKHIVASLEQD